MEKVSPPIVYWETCVCLLGLLALTWGIGYVNFGPFNLIFALAISIAKTVLIMLFFMHIKGSNRLLHLAAIAGVLWLFILLALTLSDYMSRGWIPVQGR